MEIKRMRNEYAKWIREDINPDFWFVLTFNQNDYENPLPKAACDRKVKIWEAALNRKLYPKKWYRLPVLDRLHMVRNIRKSGN